MGRNATLDRVRVLLALTVVGIHVDLFGDVSTVAEELFVNHLFRIAVPFFLIATGYFLADKLNDGRRFWAWFRRLGFLYLFWSVFYLPVMVAGHAAGRPILGVLHNLLTGFQHLWYLVGALQAALILYAARSIVARSWFALMCGLLYLVGLGIEYGSAYDVLGGAGRIAAAHGEVYRNGLFVGVPMLWLGMKLRAAAIDDGTAAGLWAGLAIASAIVLAIEFTLNLRDLPGYHLDLLVFLPLACSALFLYCLRVPTTHGGTVLPVAASAIYFLHPAVIFMLERTGWLARAGSVEIYAAVLALTAMAAGAAIPLNRAFTRRTGYSAL